MSEGGDAESGDLVNSSDLQASQEYSLVGIELDVAEAYCKSFD